ncbi:MAG TPA: DUF1566 domain-containing protein [Candidatus Limnocylindrales bacterium]|nr:DUF1566 domain-containing protein [Candidatus Limnocylindrales bacterium]
MKRQLQAMLFVAAILLPAAGSIAATADESLSKCQMAVAARTANYVRSVAKAVGECVGNVSTSVVQGASLSAAAGANAAGCASKLRKLRNSSKPKKQLDRRLRAKIASACDPAVNPKLPHSETDTWAVGSNTLSAARLTEYCLRTGGPTSIASVDEWTSCLLAASDCQANQAIALRWPRALEYLEAVRAALAAMTGTSDAVAVIAEIEQALEGAWDDNVVEGTCAPSIGLTATGQTMCDQDDGTFGACPGPERGQDGEAQSGIHSRFTDNGDGTVTDRATGLMWTQSSRDAWVNDDSRVVPGWNSSLTLHRNVPGASPSGGDWILWAFGFAGYSDWRAPNRRELESLVDLSRHDPAIDPVFHHDCTPGCTLDECACTASGPYWTTTHAEDSPHSWAVDFADGSVVQVSRDQALPVRAVRGGSTNFGIPLGKPTIRPIDIKSPWKQSCVLITFVGTDLDGRCFRGLHIVSSPQNGFLTEFVSGVATPIQRDIDADGCPYNGKQDWPPGSEYAMTPFGHNFHRTLCYVSFSSTFTGTDSLTWQMVDWEGNVSDPAVLTITIFEP